MPKHIFQIKILTHHHFMSLSWVSEKSSHFYVLHYNPPSPIIFFQAHWTIFPQTNLWFFQSLEYTMPLLLTYEFLFSYIHHSLEDTNALLFYRNRSPLFNYSYWLVEKYLLVMTESQSFNWYFLLLSREGLCMLRVLLICNFFV